MKIAIQGHPNRGKEIIQILESLGGKNDCPLTGKEETSYYYIYNNSHKGIRCHHCDYLDGCKKYTLEEFEKEFPFKIGDIVLLKGFNKPYEIIALELYMNKLCYKLDNGLHYDSETLTIYEKMKEERNITLTLDKAKEWYKKGGELKEIALQAFTEKELTKVDLPKTWEEYTQQHFHREGYVLTHLGDIAETTITGSRGGENLCPSKKSAEAHLAMIQLEQLRDCWWNGWEPDWNDDEQTKYCIVRGQEFKIHMLYESRRFLPFPTIEMAKEFLECFRDLIEKAGDLI